MGTQESIWLLSEEGILSRDGVPHPHVPFGSSAVTAGDVHGEKVAVIADGNQVWTFSSGKWNKATHEDVSLNCVLWTSDDRLLVGTEGARVAWVEEDKLNFIEGFDIVPERKQWTTPWGGPPDVRSLAVSADGTIYADIHVGWIVSSMNGGETWQSLRKGLNMDVHQVGAHPSKPETVFAATADGFHISHDHGRTFTRCSNGIPYNYQRACACFPNRDVYLASTSRGPYRGADALLYRSEDEGKNWTMVDGLPEQIEKNIDTFQIITVGAANALVIVDDVSLYETDDWGASWQKTGHNYPRLFGALAV